MVPTAVKHIFDSCQIVLLTYSIVADAKSQNAMTVSHQNSTRHGSLTPYHSTVATRRIAKDFSILT